MSSVNGQTFSFYFYPSRYFMGALLLLHTIALLALLSLPLVWWAKLAIGLVLVASLIFYTQTRVRFRSKQAVRQIMLTEAKHWRLTTQAGQTYLMHLGADSVITRYLLLLHFKQIKGKQRKNLVVFKDVLPRAQFYQLRQYCLEQTGASK